MAEVPQIGQEQEIWDGISTSGRIPEKYLARGIDNLGKMAFITRGTTRFLSMLHQRFPKSVQRNTREFQVHQIEELDRVLDVTVPSVAGDNHTRIGIPNYQAAQMQPNDMVFIKGLHCEAVLNGNGHDIYYSAAPGLVGEIYMLNWEQCMITHVDAPDSAGSDNTYVTLRRAFQGGGRNDKGGSLPAAPTPGSVTGDMTITTQMQLLRGLPNFPEGGDAPRGFHANPVTDNNFTQEFKYAVEVTKESSIEKTWIGKTPIQINELLTMKRASLDMERQYLLGRKSKSMDSEGRVSYTMGGCFEQILRDDDHMHTYSNANGISYTGMLDLGDKIMKAGGGTKRDFVCGLSLYTAIKKSFHNHDSFRFNKKDTARFDIPIESFVVSSGEWNIIPSYSMEEMGYGNCAILLDMSVPSVRPVTHPGWDMKVERNIQQKGQQIKKDQWVGIKGLEHRYAQYQHFIRFETM